MMKMIHSSDPKEQEVAKDAINAKFGLLDDFYEGKPIGDDVAQDVGLKGAMFHVSEKSASSAVAPNIAYFQGIESWFNTLGIDMRWMPLFQMETIETATEAQIIDWLNKLEHKQYDIGAPIETMPFSTETATRFGRKRFGGGSFADRSLLDTQQRYTISNLMRAHQVAELKLKANQAYTAQAAVTPNGTTAFSTNIVTTVNNAYVTLITAMAAAGYQVTADTPAYLLSHASYRAAINASFATIRGTDGDNEVLEYPVTPIFTFNTNWPSTFAGNNAGMLIVPAQKQIWVNFRTPRVEQVQDPKRDGMELIYQYYHNFQVFGGQAQIVRFA